MGNAWPTDISHDGLSNDTIPLMNARPDIPIGHTISRGDISTLGKRLSDFRPREIVSRAKRWTAGAPGGKALDPSVLHRPECFLQNAAGQALMPSGNPRPKVACNESAHGPNCCGNSSAGGRCVLRPCVSCEHDCMDAIAKQDGATYLAKMREWQAWGLNRPLELFFDDGEYLGWCTHTSTLPQTPARYLGIEFLR